MKIRVLSQTDIRKTVSMAQAIAAVKQAFAQLSAGKAEVPLRPHLNVERHEGITVIMPAYLKETDELGMKVVSVFPRNLSASLPTIHALVVMVDAATGRPVAVMDGTYLTALRTGAASGAATDLLARSDARAAAIFGTGAQGRTQLEAVCAVRSIEEVRVFDVNRGAAEAYVQEMAARGGRVPGAITIASSPAEAIRGADVICTTTTTKVPVFEDRDLAAGAHINAIGSFTPDVQEIPDETVVRARVFVDSREACWAETGDLIIPRNKGLIKENHVHAELGEIVAGEKSGRSSPGEITLFKSVGNAVQDVAVGSRVLEGAARLGLGVELEL
jgi:ornithine cyclodeaminase